MYDLISIIKNKSLEQDLLKVLDELNQNRNQGKLVETPFTIGVMGKSGAGKSTLINGLCQDLVCKSGAVGGCTREIQKVSAYFGNMPVLLVDFPGIAENEKWNESYIELYKNYLDQIDVLLWVIKLDDRALVEDEQFFQNHLSSELRYKTILVLSQSDKAEPTREWHNEDYLPSNKQKEIIQHKRHLLHKTFNKSTLTNHCKKIGIVPVSVDFSITRQYNLERLLEIIVLRLAGYRGDQQSTLTLMSSVLLFDNLNSSYNSKNSKIITDFIEKLKRKVISEDEKYLPLEEPKDSPPKSSEGSFSVRRGWF